MPGRHEIVRCLRCGHQVAPWNLTSQQQQVLALLAQGASNTAIAESLTLTIKSVENYINIIFSKQGLSDPMINKRVKATLLWLES